MTTTAEMIGVVGGGQLARMMVEAAAERQVAVAVQTGSTDDPACAGSSRQVIADPRDVAGTRQLVVGCQGITFENEWVNIDALIPLGTAGCAVPSGPFCPLTSGKQAVAAAAVVRSLDCRATVVSVESDLSGSASPASGVVISGDGESGPRRIRRQGDSRCGVD